ncbi:glutathione S-transferase [Bacillus sp. NP157]|nr:glutathione S-transferase [Bacillus sp. NP157]
MTILQLHQSNNSPNSRRVRIFLAEKGIIAALVPVDLGAGEQHGDAYRAVNPRRVVPTLVTTDGVAIGEVPAIFRYIEDAFPAPTLYGDTPAQKAVTTMWERRAELEGFAAVMEGIRNKVAGLKGRAIAGPHDYDQIPELVTRAEKRVANFFADLDARLSEATFVAGDTFTAADITALVTVDFAKGALSLVPSADQQHLLRWHALVSSRPSASA